MISAISIEKTYPTSTFQASHSGTLQKIKKAVHESFWIPISTGVAVGIYALSFNVVFASILLSIPGIESFLSDPPLADEYLEGITSSFWNMAIEGPFWEEVIFRCLIQNVFKWISEQILPDQNVQIFSYSIKLAALVGIVATAILFGLAHLGNGLGIVQVILTTLLGVSYGILKENYGLRSSIAAHMTNNAIVYVGVLL